MSTLKIPSFSSFPDLDSEAQAGPSTVGKVPRLPTNFESFPDLGAERDEEVEEARERKKKREKERKKEGSQRKEKERDRDAKRRDRHKDAHSPRRSRERHESRHRERDERKERKHRKETHQATANEQNGWNFVDERGRTGTGTGTGDDVDMFKAERGIESLTAVTYFTDRKGDAMNVAYGGLHSHDVPKYKMVGWGRRILGLGSEWHVGRRSGGGVEISLGRGWKAPELSDRKALALLTNTQTKPMIPSKTRTMERTFVELEVDGFLPLSTRKKERNTNEQSYRSITREEQHDAESDSEMSVSEAGDEDSSSDESTTSPLSVRQEALRTLEQRLTANPSSISDWMTLLDYSLAEVPIFSKNAQRARSEIATAILFRALAASPENSHSALLWMKYLRVGEDIWDERRLKDEWEKALKGAASADLWIEWFNWRLRRPAAVIDEAKEDAARLAQHVSVGLTAEEADFARLRAFWRIAIFFKVSGYVELATSMFQVQAELSFMLPANTMGLPFEQQLNLLEDFWEAEGSRIGDHAGAQQSHNTKLSSSKNGAHSDDPLLEWARTESQDDNTLLLPAKSSDENDDPYATILFTDIRAYVIPLGTRRGKRMFRLIWLDFLGLGIPGLSSALATSSPRLDERWCRVSVTSEELLRKLFPLDQSKLNTADSVAGALVGREREYRSSFGVVKEWSLDAFDPLDGVGVAGQGRMWESFDGDVNLVRRILQQLRLGEDDVEGNMLTVAFEAAVDVKSAIKISRSLLSESRDSIELWSAHARLECIRGQRDKAIKIYQTVLSSTANKSILAPVFWAYAELEWLSSHDEKALAVIFSAAEEKTSMGAVALLRTTRWLDDAIRASLAGDWKIRLCWIKLRILLELLARNTLEGAMDIADRYLGDELERGSSHEALTIASLLVFYHHTITLRNPSPPALLRERVHAALELYPNNTVILGLFLECEKGEGIWGRVRDWMGEAGVNGRLKEKSLMRRLGEVWVASWDKGRWREEVERVRSGFEAATFGDLTRGSAILWRVYIEFEMRYGDTKKLKGLVYRALSQCPFVKDFYLLAFGHLRSLYTLKELNSLADAMSEKGIRMRTAPEEILQDLEREAEAKSVSTNSKRWR